MKTLLVILAMLTIHSTSFAAMHGFSCGGMGHDTVFSAIFEGGRYADMVQVRLEKNEMTDLVRREDLNADISNGQITLNLQMGACNRGTGDVLVECRLAADAWSNFGWNYEVKEADSHGFSRTIHLSTDVGLNALKLQVVKVGTQAKLILNAQVDTKEEQNKEIRLEKVLAPLEGWYSCKFDK